MNIESELISLIKTTVKEMATLSAQQDSCKLHVNEKIAYILEELKTKYDKEDGDALMIEIKHLKDVLNLDNSSNVKRNNNILGMVVSYILYTIALISILSGIIAGILHIMGVF